MTITEALLEASTSSSQIVRATVRDVDRNGKVDVVTEFGCLRCEVLERGSGEVWLDVGDSVLVWYPMDASDSAIIIGRVGHARRLPVSPSDSELTGRQHEVSIADNLVLEASESLVLRTGDSSITMRADGKILIKGNQVVSHAKKMNRVKGGAVAIN